MQLRHNQGQSPLDRFVEPERSRLEFGQVEAVAREVDSGLAAHVAGAWEELVRTAVPRGAWFDRSWRPASSWWGPGSDRTPLELDVVAESTDGRALLLGEVKWGQETDVRRLAADLAAKAARFPPAAGRTLCLGLWLAGRPTGRGPRGWRSSVRRRSSTRWTVDAVLPGYGAMGAGALPPPRWYRFTISLCSAKVAEKWWLPSFLDTK